MTNFRYFKIEVRYKTKGKKPATKFYIYRIPAEKVIKAFDKEKEYAEGHIEIDLQDSFFKAEWSEIKYEKFMDLQLNNQFAFYLNEIIGEDPDPAEDPKPVKTVKDAIAWCHDTLKQNRSAVTAVTVEIMLNEILENIKLGKELKDEMIIGRMFNES